MHELLLALLISIALNPLAFFWAACPCCHACTNCDGITPSSFQVVITGMVDADCTNCAAVWNGTFVIPKAPGLGPCLIAGDCNFEFDNGVAVSGGGSCAAGSGGDWAVIDLQITTSGGDYLLTVNLRRVVVTFTNTCVNVTRFQKNFGTTKPDCASWSALDVPWTTDFGAYCVGSGATCTVTAL